MKYREGDIVRISKKCDYYGRNSFNPRDIDGEVVEIDWRDTIKVEWENGNNSWYREEHLKLRKRA